MDIVAFLMLVLTLVALIGVDSILWLKLRKLSVPSPGADRRAHPKGEALQGPRGSS